MPLFQGLGYTAVRIKVDEWDVPDDFAVAGITLAHERVLGLLNAASDALRKEHDKAGR